jgi:hypothetical protein
MKLRFLLTEKQKVHKRLTSLMTKEENVFITQCLILEMLGGELWSKMMDILKKYLNQNEIEIWLNNDNSEATK